MAIVAMLRDEPAAQDCALAIENRLVRRMSAVSKPRLSSMEAVIRSQSALR
jgi:uncharacterized protein with PIN domain